MNEPTLREVLVSVARCATSTVRLLAARRLAMPRDRVGTEFAFADGSRSVVFRETVARNRSPEESVLLLVSFRLRFIGRNRLAHKVFRVTCVVDTPLFAGFPGFRSKYWLADLETGDYRGAYDWNGAAAAEHYARVLSRILALVTVLGSVRWRIVPGRLAGRVPAHGHRPWQVHSMTKATAALIRLAAQSAM